ncbi:3-deoxy-D-manno-octulosonic acid transferase [Candidatus Omnitrophota bacterium]
MFVFFNIIYVIASIVIFPVLFIRGKWHKDFWTRCGLLPKGWGKEFDGQDVIWIHAVSVGEVLTVCGFIRKLNARFKHKTIVCSVVTTTGYALAQKRLSTVATIMYAPLDFSWVVKKYIRVIHPSLYIAAETEIWPNLYTALAQQNIAIVQVNGRISDKSFRGYKNLSFLFKSSLAAVQLFCMQSDRDAKRIKAIGARGEIVRTMGNLKFDGSVGSVESDQTLNLLLLSDPAFFVAGSTHPGEEEIACDVFRSVKDEFEGLRLIIVPRHIERVSDVVRVIAQQGFNPIKLSTFGGRALKDQDVLVVDTIGKLAQIYAHATLVFIGKTFCVGGGQNMIEPASFAKPTIVGPQTENFKDVMQLFLDDQAIIQVKTVEALKEKTQWLLSHREEAARIGARAQAVVRRNQGATDRCLDAVAAFIK